MLNRWSTRFLSSGLLVFSLGLTVACGAKPNTETAETTEENGPALTETTEENGSALSECLVVSIEDVAVTSATPEETAIVQPENGAGEAVAVNPTAETTTDVGDEADTAASTDETDEKANEGVEAVVKLDCGGTVVDVPWRQFRQKLKVNPLKFRDRLPQFEARINCVPSPDSPNEVLCQTTKQEGTGEFQTLGVQPNP